MEPDNINQPYNNTVENMDNQQPENKKKFPLFLKITIPLAIIVVIAAVAITFFLKYKSETVDSTDTVPDTSTKSVELKKFASDEEYKNYFKESENSMSGSYFGISLRSFAMQESAVSDTAAGFGAPVAALDSSPKRVSDTNVQVAGIDEPDIVKTDGKNIFYSSDTPYYMPLREPVMLEQRAVQGVPVDDVIPPQFINTTKLISAFPVDALEKISDIDKTGDLLLVKNTLVVFSGTSIFGYDISDTKNPKQTWNFEFENTQQIVTSRLFDGKIYIVSKTYSRSSSPCPIPLSTGVSSITISCTDVYRPSITVPVDSVYTITILDPANGNATDNQSFVGSNGQTAVYMNQNNIYVTYPIVTDMTKFFYDFYIDKAQDLISDEATEKLKKLETYDISSTSKMMEVQLILENYLSSLSDDERLRVQNETENRLSEYTKSKMRDFEKTGIVKMSTADLEVKATNLIPGSPLNQFSLDEYKDNLRIATTVGQNFWGSAESANDVYVLDKNLQVVGTVENLGLDERIYSARFIDDKGYLVTFRQTDPFYVLDLSDPKNPQVKGELKIPGFSSYLHPVVSNLILGVGREDSKVKLSLFDVSDPSNPTEVSKYTLDEYYTDVQNTHHAFLHDPDKQVFFLPGGQGGYVFSYSGKELSLVKAISTIAAKRALYIDNFMYVVGDSEIVVIDEANWEEVRSLKL